MDESWPPDAHVVFGTLCAIFKNRKRVTNRVVVIDNVVACQEVYAMAPLKVSTSTLKSELEDVAPWYDMPCAIQEIYHEVTQFAAEGGFRSDKSTVTGRKQFLRFLKKLRRTTARDTVEESDQLLGARRVSDSNIANTIAEFAIKDSALVNSMSLVLKANRDQQVEFQRDTNLQKIKATFIKQTYKPSFNFGRRCSEPVHSFGQFVPGGGGAGAGGSSGSRRPSFNLGVEMLSALPEDDAVTGFGSDDEDEIGSREEDLPLLRSILCDDKLRQVDDKSMRSKREGQQLHRFF